MKLKIATSAIALAMLGGCIIIDADDGDIRTDFNSGDWSYGTVYGADVSNDTIAFQVSSNGCTEREFFEVDVKEDDDAFEIGLRRTRTDYCDAVIPEGVAVGWTYSELGIPAGAEVTVRNRVRR